MELKNKIKKEVGELYSYGHALLIYEGVIRNEISVDQVKKLTDATIYNHYVHSYANFNTEYQSWYFKSNRVVKQLAPERADEFSSLYKTDQDQKNYTYSTYTISDYLKRISISSPLGSKISTYTALSSRFSVQLGIIKAIYSSIDSLIIDIEGVIQSSFFDSEIKSAEDLYNKNHLRASGAICGVVLEKHFTKVCANHGINFKKKNPTIFDYNESLKNNCLIDTPMWRLIASLSDLRNLCVHNKDRDPEPDDIDSLLRGCKKVIAEVY